jgi:hypothetical protein
MIRRETLKLMGLAAAASLAAQASIPPLPQATEPELPEAGKIAGPFELRQTVYVISSHHQAHDLPVRVLLPKQLEKVKSPAVLYVLPVEPEIQFKFGDGLTTVEHEDLHNKFGLVAVAPSFSDWPWYANHPTDPKIQQEAYFLEDVVPLINRLYPKASKKRLLVGFSKSGNGAYQLLLRHPELFTAASIWDAPIMYDSPQKFEMPRIYGDQRNFDEYCIPPLLRRQANLLSGKPPRLALFGYSLFGGPHPTFGPHIEEAHALMESLRIPHIYDDSSQREHRWDSGWLEPAVTALATMSRSKI